MVDALDGVGIVVAGVADALHAAPVIHVVVVVLVDVVVDDVVAVVVVDVVVAVVVGVVDVVLVSLKRRLTCTPSH